jgi:hypothetical protein
VKHDHCCHVIDFLRPVNRLLLFVCDCASVAVAPLEINETSLFTDFPASVSRAVPGQALPMLPSLPASATQTSAARARQRTLTNGRPSSGSSPRSRSPPQLQPGHGARAALDRHAEPSDVLAAGVPGSGAKTGQSLVDVHQRISDLAEKLAVAGRTWTRRSSRRFAARISPTKRSAPPGSAKISSPDEERLYTWYSPPSTRFRCCLAMIFVQAAVHRGASRVSVEARTLPRVENRQTDQSENADR